MNSFTPIGPRARWREIYDNAAALPPGAILTYTDIETLIGYDVSAPGAARSPIYRANRALLTEHSRMLVAVPGKGYRVAHATEHEHQAKGQQRKARRRLSTAVTVAVNVDRNQLTAAQQKSLDGLADVLMAQNAMLASHNKRLGSVEKDVAKVDDRVDVLEQALRAHGIAIPERRTVDGETLDT